MFKKNSVFIIAEAGINHNGDLETAEKMVLAAKKCGADAIKFQSLKAEELIIEEAGKAEHIKGKQSFFEMIKSWELSENDYKKLADFAKKEGIIFFASVFGKQSLNIMKKAGMPLYKIASCDLNNHFLLKEVAKTRKPVIISTGMGDIKEIKEAVKILEKGSKKIGILHCVSLYPPEAQELNLQRIQLLEKIFPKYVIGYSDHTLDILAPAAAVALGANIIEKHFTLDKNMPGPDQPSSADPAEFKKMIEQIRFLEKAINRAEKNILPGKRESEMRKIFRRSLVANEEIAGGSIITAAKLGIKRPGTGIPASQIEKVIGKKAKRNLEKNTILKFGDLI
ncbi:MAG: N-acetylneuraminate synthase [Parcubacteria group bacterium GW2011_GWC1_43_12]|nr:MAG: N-acetylneuraminate synthase [Parcubacteria group bacterium GW2011_GWB1_42_6]KKS92289.1 MAG: N-acetylneuraminate synthase [Parcubacteria group bacterium GW2011_GWC1_43_12]